MAAIAAGSVVASASYKGFGNGTARGGVPSARIASYKVCWSEGCSTADVMKAIDEALKDGVDIISISIGYRNSSRHYLRDLIAIGAFHAEQNGVLVVLAAGNRGPLPYTVGHTAPWMFSVAASTIDRHFTSAVRLGNGRILNVSNFVILTLIQAYYYIYFIMFLSFSISLIRQSASISQTFHGHLYIHS